MKVLLAMLVALHGALHLLGFVKGFGFAEVARLSQPTSRGAGALWLLVALMFVASAVLLVSAPRFFWIAALPGVVLSQILITAAWRDAKWGTIPNLIILVPIALALLDLRPSSLRSTYDRDVQRAVAGVSALKSGTSMGTVAAAPLVTEADLVPLPPLVRTYLHRVGVVGKPRVKSFRAVFRAEMRAKPDAKWMTAAVEQVNVFEPPARLFFMKAWRSSVPFDVFHRYVDAAATMQVRVAGLVPVVDARGPELTRSETVTILNDMCMLAPATLIGPALTWRTLDPSRVKVTFSNAGHTVSAELSFDDQSDLVGFVSHDRYQSDGKTHRLFPWSTPLGGYRDFDGVRLAARGEARWREPSGEWTYGRFVLERITYN